MSTPRRQGTGCGSRGFALLTVIAAIVVMSLLAGAITLTVDRLRSASAVQQQALEGTLAAYSTRSTLLFMLATQRMTFAGLTAGDPLTRTAPAQSMSARNPAGSDGEAISFVPTGHELRLDGTLYRGLGTSTFALQDDRGLLSVNWAVPGMMQGLLHRLGVPLDARGRLIQALRDYQKALAPGAIAFAGDGLSAGAGSHGALAHHVLLTPYQLLSIPAWRPYLERWSDRQIGRFLTTTRNVSVNLNSAPAAVMETLPGVEPSQVKRVIDLRDETALASESMGYALLPGIPEGSGLLMLYPSNSGTLTCWPTRGQPGVQVHYTLTPFGPHGKPWRIDYVVHLAQPPPATVPARRAAGAPLLAREVPAQPGRTGTAASGAWRR